MKPHSPVFITVALLFICNAGFSQSDTVFFNSGWKECARNEAKFYRLVTPDKKKYIVKDFYFHNHHLQMMAVCSSVTPLVKDGACTYFREDGTRESEGSYKDDKRIGSWIWWDENGSDSSVAEISSKGKYDWKRKTKEYTANEKTFTFVQEMPAYPGGEKKMLNFLKKNIKYPKEARVNKIEGTVILEFVVTEQGTIIGIKALRSVGGGCTEEAIRVIKLMPKWKPGKQNGELVKVYFHLPITFKMR